MDVAEAYIEDGLIAPIWLLANALVACFAWRLSRFAYPRDRLPQLALSATLLYIATIVATTTVLGACGLLKPMLLLALSSLLSLVGIGLLRKRLISLGNQNKTSRHAGADQQHAPPCKRFERLVWVGWSVLLACLIGHVIINGLGGFPAEFDGLAYHIPLIDHWLQAQSLYAPDSAWWWTSANAEVVGLWMVAPFSGDFLIALINLPFIVLWALAAIEVGRQIGLSIGWRHLASLGMLTVHTTFHEAEKAMNDVAVAACFFAAIAYSFRYVRSGNRHALVWSGISLGLLFGTKYFAVGYAALAFCTVIMAASLRFSWRRAVSAGATLSMAAAPFASYWYLRNLWLTGTPVYPLGGTDAGMGYPHLWRTTFVGNGQPELLNLATEALWKMTGPCHAAAACALPLAFCCLVLTGTTRLRRGKRSNAAVLLALAALLAGTGAVFACTPFAVEDQPGTLNHLRWAYTPARYGLCFLSMADLAFVWLLRESSKLGSRLLGQRFTMVRWSGAISAGLPGLFAVALAYQFHQRTSYLSRHAEYLSKPNLLSAALLAANLAGFTWLAIELYSFIVRSRLAVGITMAVALGGASVGGMALSRHWHGGFANHFDAICHSKIISRLAAQQTPLRLAVLEHRPYPFFGSARQYRVCAPRLLTTYEDLIHYLSSRRPDMVVSPRRNTGNVFDRYKPGPEWIKANGSQFESLPLDGGHFMLFSFVQSSAQPSMTIGADRVSAEQTQPEQDDALSNSKQMVGDAEAPAIPPLNRRSSFHYDSANPAPHG